MTQVLTAASEISDRVMGFAHSIGLSAMVGGRTPKSTELQSVVRVGDCSGVLIQPDIVLTSAHCVEGPVDVTAMGRTFGVTSCAKHPGYEPGRPAHDIGFCRLATSVPASAIALDDGSLVAGGLVSMAGYGLSNAFAREVQVLRVVDSSVVRVGKDSVDVGTGDHTACNRPG